MEDPSRKDTRHKVLFRLYHADSSTTSRNRHLRSLTFVRVLWHFLLALSRRLEPSGLVSPVIRIERIVRRKL